MSDRLLATLYDYGSGGVVHQAVSLAGSQTTAKVALKQGHELVALITDSDWTASNITIAELIRNGSALGDVGAAFATVQIADNYSSLADAVLTAVDPSKMVVLPKPIPVGNVQLTFGAAQSDTTLYLVTKPRLA